jgi:hypothetical protein
MSPAFPETLSAEWVPAVPVGRQPELARLLAQLRATQNGQVPSAAVFGPPGAGSSILARLAARSWAEELPAPGSVRRVIPVRVRWCSGTVGVASALLRSFDEGFGGRGFSVAEVMAGFVRRLFRLRARVAIVLDDAGASSPDLAPILSALRAPDRFLPEGAPSPPTWALLVAGNSHAPALRSQLAAAGFPSEEYCELERYSFSALAEIVTDRAGRALGHAPAPEWVREVVEQVRVEGGGAARALDLLRERLIGADQVNRPFLPHDRPSLTSVEPRLLAAIARAAHAGPCDVSEIRKWEEEYSRRAGARPLALTTLWRRMVRLEQMGVLVREVRSGGPGGTRSVIRVHRPLFEASGLRDPKTPRARAAAGLVPPWLVPEEAPSPPPERFAPSPGGAGGARGAPIPRAPSS